MKGVDSFERLLDDPEIRLIAAAAVPCERGPLGCRVLRAGKDYFTDKTPFTTLDQLAQARQVVAETGRKYMVYYSERLHVEAAVFAGQLIEQGAIGKVVEVIGFGPHRLSAPIRPAWFFEKAKYGGILCDIGSHQFEQFLYFSGATDASVLSSTVANKATPDYPELEDFGEAHLIGNNGATNFIRVDWLTPDASRIWGDGRTFILGTEGYMELRKFIEVGRGEGGDQLYLVNHKVEEHYSLEGKVGFPFFWNSPWVCVGCGLLFPMKSDAQLKAHVKALFACNRCPAMHKPVISGAAVMSKVLLVGQAPGVKEPVLGRPFAWTAGKTMFRWFSEQCGVDEAAFRSRVYMAAVCRCFPGKNAHGGDRVPSPAEIAECGSWLDAELRILKPELVIPVGKLAIAQFLPVGPLVEMIGRSLRGERAGVAFDLVPLPHPSGASPWHRIEPGRTLLHQALGQIARHPAWEKVREERR